MANSDLAAIEAVLHTYFDGLHEGDTEKLAASFHACSHLYSAEDGGLLDQPRATWFDRVRNRPAPSKAGLARHDQILFIDQSGPDTAIAKVACAIPPRFFTDYLSLLKTAEGWKIVSKIFRTEMREG
ncbi:nuclear transport factor 2 family protein [Plastoroseomonas hellenica]|uniref:Nuclear transport factor 2 family protein n=1 Tax=Plastoroseomonas hellenica TaxID=2687306 RepID=A0ABS5ESY7_9PROT|nr:nuclear transport factor 2 family protein [Plastoroseomonas hellenica]MBR0645085.1 nuclear transport factor 2 family protein [Plastoroseomonas hellenica]MBR0663399.1 nuclear transport factor 2 family protein [Plastoroseomonas hellenica]